MRRLSRPFGIGVVASISAVACAGNFDTTREARPFEKEATLGQEVYGVLCDRVGASALAEDLEGSSYYSLCHPDAKGRYGDMVKTELLPAAPPGTASVARNLSVAKLEALARRRGELIKAFDVIAPDIEFDDPYPPKDASGKATPRKVRMQTALAELLTRLNPLYDSNPLAAEGGIDAPLLPASTQALSRVFDAMAASKDAQSALARIGGRKGYRPLAAALGVVQPVLSYPDLRTISQQSVRLLSPGGPARDQFVQLLTVVHEELRTSETELPLGPFRVDDTNGIAQPNRARDNLEVMQNVLLATDASFGHGSLSGGLIVLRDNRGFALVNGSLLGVPGSVSAPFTDSDGDGLGDVDDFGRFIGAQGQPVSVDLPFLVPGEPRIRPADSMGRAVLDNGDPAYQYLDTTQTFASSLLRDLDALIDPDPTNNRETVMYALAGANALMGDRVSATQVYGTGNDAKTISYTGFNPDTSPLVDLIYATGQVLADPQSDDFLQQMIDLFENHEQEVARFVGVALEMKRIADEHPEAGLPRNSIFWDQMAEVLTEVSHVGPVAGEGADGPGLLEDILLALQDERTAKLGEVYSKFMTFRDVMNYNLNDINGSAFNYTSNNDMFPHEPVDRSQPTVGDNRSMFDRSMQIIYDSTGTTACSKANAHVHLEAKLLGFIQTSMTYPDDAIFNLTCFGANAKKDPLDWCDIFRIEDMTQFYLKSIIEDDPLLAPALNKHEAELVVQDNCLNSLNWATNMDDAFETSSGITGLTTKPTHFALNRLVFFGADSANYPNLPDLDPFRNDDQKLNYKVNRFISGLQEPMGTPLCAKNAAGVNICSNVDDMLRVRNKGTLFLWEQFGFAEANRPVLYAFYKHDREDLFASMVDVIYFAMRDDQHGPECDPSGNWRRNAPDFNPRYCSEDGLVRYEPMMAEQLQTDLIPALRELVKVVAAQRIQSTRYRAAKGEPIERRGTELMSAVTQLLFDAEYSAQRGITKRDGSKSTKWSDGVTDKAQVTPYDLFAEALRKIDDRFESAPGFDAADLEDRRAQWRRARSQLVDQFLAVDGSGASAKFRNPAIPKAIVRVLKTLREQLNANCPEREKGVECKWAREDMARKMADTMRGPLFGALIDLTEALRADPSRVEIERLVNYLLDAVSDDETLRNVLASAVDLILVLRDGQTLPPVFNVLSALSVPDDETAAPGAADITLQLLNVLSRDPDDTHGPDDPLLFDRYRVLDRVLPNLVKPIDPSEPSKTALEVLIDVAADVHRYDSAEAEPLAGEDYRVIAESVREFLVDDKRGMEQLYEVVRGAKGN